MNEARLCSPRASVFPSRHVRRVNSRQANGKGKSEEDGNARCCWSGEKSEEDGHVGADERSGYLGGKEIQTRNDDVIEMTRGG